MREKLTGRVGRIITGSFHALVDAVESAAPEVVMEQALREIDGAIEEVRAELATVIANKHLANTRLGQVNARIEDLVEKIELAVTENRDDLAEAAISRQLDIEAQVPVLENQITDLGSEEKELESYIAALQGKKREMKEELLYYKNSMKEGAPAEIGSAAGRAGVESRVSQAESAFDRVLGNATGMSSDSLSTDKASAAALNELEDLARRNRVQERLAAIKKTRGEG